MMKESLLKIAAATRLVITSALSVAMPIIWWSPIPAVSLLAIPVWIALMCLTVAHRKRSKEMGYKKWRFLALAFVVYLPFVALAATFRAARS